MSDEPESLPPISIKPPTTSRVPSQTFSRPVSYRKTADDAAVLRMSQESPLAAPPSSSSSVALKAITGKILSSTKRPLKSIWTARAPISPGGTQHLPPGSAAEPLEHCPHLVGAGNAEEPTRCPTPGATEAVVASSHAPGPLDEELAALQSEVLGIVEIAGQLSWFAVAATESRFSQVRGWTSLTPTFLCSGPPMGSGGADILHCMKESEAVLIVIEIGDIESSLEVISKIRDCLGDSPIPVMALLLTPSNNPGVLNDLRLLAEVQERLLEANVDDVICKLGSLTEVRAALSMSISRFQAAGARFRQLEQNIRQHYEVELHQRVAEREDKRPEPPCGMFWRAIHRIFDGFPPLRRDIDWAPVHGAQLGPCQFQDVLGRGTFGIVFAVLNKENVEKQAVKVVAKQSLTQLDDVIALWKEMRYMNRLRHPNIIGIRGALHGPNHIFLMMERGGSHNLFRILKKAGGMFSEERARVYQVQLMNATYHCHTRGVVHRDLKPENIAVNEDGLELKVLDFGTAVSVGKAVRDIAGTMPFMAPEVMIADEETPYDPAPTDCWSMGIILFEMLCGVGRLERLLGWDRKVFPCEERADDAVQFFSSSINVVEAMNTAMGAAADPALIQVIQGMLEVDWTTRWTARQIKDSTWLTAGGAGRTTERLSERRSERSVDPASRTSVPET